MNNTVKQWSTRENDLHIAAKIIGKYIDFNDGMPIGIFEVNAVDGSIGGVKLSDWVIELSDFFCSKYGEERGDAVTKKVLGCCMTQGRTVH